MNYVSCFSVRTIALALITASSSPANADLTFANVTASKQSITTLHNDPGITFSYSHDHRLRFTARAERRHAPDLDGRAFVSGHVVLNATYLVTDPGRTVWNAPYTKYFIRSGIETDAGVNVNAAARAGYNWVSADPAPWPFYPDLSDVEYRVGMRAQVFAPEYASPLTAQCHISGAPGVGTVTRHPVSWNAPNWSDADRPLFNWATMNANHDKRVDYLTTELQLMDLEAPFPADQYIGNTVYHSPRYRCGTAWSTGFPQLQLGGVEGIVSTSGSIYDLSLVKTVDWVEVGGTISGFLPFPKLGGVIKRKSAVSGQSLPSMRVVVGDNGSFSVPLDDLTETTIFALEFEQGLTKVIGSFGPNAGPLNISTEALLGDIDGDEEVSILDFIILSNYSGATATDATYFGGLDDPYGGFMADLDKDGEVGILDYLILSSAFGSVGDQW